MRRRALAGCCVLAVLSGCAPSRPTLPSGPGSAFPGFEAAYEEAVQECRPARSVLAELGLSGRAGDTRLRGRINAGLAAPDSLRLEGVAFGSPIFILAARRGEATLLLVREDRVVRGAPQAIVEALTGVALTPAELLAAVAGCGLGAGVPASGRIFGSDWAAVDAGGGLAYLRRIGGRWRVAAAVRGELTILYADFASGLPATVHLRAGNVADITLRVSQLEINTSIDAKAFEVDVPPGAQPLTIEELRRSGPLGER
jgi:hypothetical protein